MTYTDDKRGTVVLAVRPESIRLRRDRRVLHGTLMQAYYLGDIPTGSPVWLDFV